MFFSKRKRKEGDGADAQQGTFLKGIATISNPLKWPGMLSNRSAKSGQQGGLGELSAADTALRELEIFMEQLCSEPKFSNMNTSSASLLELSAARVLMREQAQRGSRRWIEALDPPPRDEPR